MALVGWAQNSDHRKNAIAFHISGFYDPVEWRPAVKTGHSIHFETVIAKTTKYSTFSKEHYESASIVGTHLVSGRSPQG